MSGPTGGISGKKVTGMEEPKEQIKIFHTDETSESQEQEDFHSLVLDLVRQKDNGNLEKARQLGAILAAEVESDDGEFVFGDASAEENHDLVLQRRLLLAFVIDHGLNVFCPNSIITEIASSSFYETIQEDAPGIYEDIRENGAFSYYLLCVRNGDRIDEEIGATFADLIGHKGDHVYQELGTALYLRFMDVVGQKVKELGFVG